MTEDMPLAAHTVKGKVRVRMWQDALDAMRAGRISGVTEVRASDFISPRYTLLERALPAMRAGRTVWLPTPLDVPHTFTYTGDVARALDRARPRPAGVGPGLARPLAAGR